MIDFLGEIEILLLEMEKLLKIPGSAPQFKLKKIS